MFYQVKAYLKFLLKATNQHGVHSPFVFNLVTKCFYNKTHYTAYSQIKAYRNLLLNSTERISITDFGAGSKRFKSNQRRIADLAKHVGISKKNAALLFRLSNYFSPLQVLELGTSLALGTQAISLGAPNAEITSIEGCPNISKFATRQCSKLKLDRVSIINGEFSKILSTLNTPKFDMVFFDGNHQKEATLNYFESLLPKAHNDSIFIFDDIYWSAGMTEAWHTIKAHPKVSVTIDTYQWGMVFFRKEQAKEHFTIRI